MIEHLLQGNQPLGLESYINDDVLVGQLDDCTAYNVAIDSLGSFLCSLLMFKRLQQGAEIHLFFMVSRIFRLGGDSWRFVVLDGQRILCRSLSMRLFS